VLYSPLSSDTPEFSSQRRISFASKEGTVSTSSFAEAVRKLGEPTLIKNSQVVSRMVGVLLGFCLFVMCQPVYLERPSPDSRLRKSRSSSDSRNRQVGLRFRRRVANQQFLKTRMAATIGCTTYLRAHWSTRRRW